MPSFIDRLSAPITRVANAMNYVVPHSHHAFLALFFLAGLEVMFALHQWVITVLAVVLLLTIVGVLIIRIEEQPYFHILQAVLPIMSAIGTTVFSLFIPVGISLHLFFVASAFLFFFVLKNASRNAYPSWNRLISFAVFFFIVAAILGWRFNLYLPIYLLLFLLYPTVMFLSLQSLIRYTKTSAEAWFLSMVIAFAVGELAWVLQFLPLHFFTQAGILAVVYYVIFQLLSTSYEHRLVRRDITEHVSLGTIALLILLITAQWT